MEVVNALGRRKSAVARIYVTEGTGKITINKRDLTEYFPSTILQFVVKQPLTTVDAVEKYDIKVNLAGGGYTGQSQACRRLYDTRQPRGRAQKARTSQSTSSLPVQQALMLVLKTLKTLKTLKSLYYLFIARTRETGYYV